MHTSTHPPTAPITRDIVLVGGGHSHVGVLRYFAMHPLPGVRLSLICTDVHTPYSGMLPGYVAGHYDYDAVHIDLLRLCAATGARFVQGEVVGVDRQARTVQLRERPDIAYDLLSINTGSTPQLHTPGAAQHAVPVKPISGFQQHWLQLLGQLRSHNRGGPGLRIAVVGAGAGGVELCLAMQHRLRAEQALHSGGAAQTLEFHLFASGPLLPTHNAAVRAHFARVLAQRGVQLHLHSAVVEVQSQRLRSADGQWHSADAIFWVTQASGAAWLRNTGLELDPQDCIWVHPSLQSTCDAHIFAAGDVASITHTPLEKAGVFAVRMGVPLARNLQRALLQLPLRPYRAQRRWLALISTGDRYAVASRGRFYAAGAWVWRWKDWIDRRFMQRFTVHDSTGLPGLARRPQASAPTQTLTHPALPGLSAAETQQAQAAQAMRCGGCGAKVGASVLQQALHSLPAQTHPDVLIGLAQADDAAVVRIPAGHALAHSVDFFRAMLDDPYLLGRIAANHALGDLFAMGAQPHTASAIATVPPGLDRQVQATLAALMAGAVQVLNAAGCTLVGGHSSEGAELALGFSVHGLVALDAQGLAIGLLPKGGMQPGDVLLLTKALGTGTVLAAHAQAAARGRWVQAALHSMLQSNQAAAHILRSHGARACTDITGFGLAGHLLEMARPSGVQVALDMQALPVLDGALACLAQGWRSSLHSANARPLDALYLAHGDALHAHPHSALLFDPQTAGGLLASVPAAQAPACLAALHAQGYTQACAIGHVQALPSDQPRNRPLQSSP